MLGSLLKGEIFSAVPSLNYNQRWVVINHMEKRGGRKAIPRIGYLCKGPETWEEQLVWKSQEYVARVWQEYGEADEVNMEVVIQMQEQTMWDMVGTC